MNRPVGISPFSQYAPFVERINAKGVDDDRAALFAAALGFGGDNLVQVLETLVSAPIDPHIAHYLDEFPQYVPLILGIFRAVASGSTKLSVRIVDEGDTDITVNTTDGVLVLSVLTLTAG